jgi:hypothetical protein
MDAPGESVTVHEVEVPACATVTVLPATVAVPVRELALGFAAMESATGPLPLPEAGLTAIHDTPLEAVQAQPESVVTARLAVPAPAPIDTSAGDTE